MRDPHVQVAAGTMEGRAAAVQSPWAGAQVQAAHVAGAAPRGRWPRAVSGEQGARSRPQQHTSHASPSGSASETASPVPSVSCVLRVVNVLFF